MHNSFFRSDLRALSKSATVAVSLSPLVLNTPLIHFAKFSVPLYFENILKD